jgi:hypothetical protein
MRTLSVTPKRSVVYTAAGPREVDVVDEALARAVSGELRRRGLEFLPAIVRRDPWGGWDHGFRRMLGYTRTEVGHGISLDAIVRDFLNDTDPANPRATFGIPPGGGNVLSE